MMLFLMVLIAIGILFGPVAFVAEKVLDVVFEFFGVYEKLGY